jgi:hypothetical protein
MHLVGWELAILRALFPRMQVQMMQRLALFVIKVRELGMSVECYP